MTEEDYMQEALAHQAAWMESQRRKDTFALEDAAIGGTIKPLSISDQTTDQDIQDAKAAARAYAAGRNSNTRIRSYNESSEEARAGVQSALSWLDRKRKSAIRK